MEAKKTLPTYDSLSVPQVKDISGLLCDQRYFFNSFKSNFTLQELKYWYLPKIHDKFIKIGVDHLSHYGDGGYADIKIPLFYANKLKVLEETRLQLVNELESLGSKRKDYHMDSPVMDIIDPDLNPNYCYNLSEKTDERLKYAWFPVNIVIDKNQQNIRFLGEIRDLDQTTYGHLYQLILEAFKEMLPGFKELDLLNEKGDTILQVVIKAQKYIIQPNTSYTGKWHVEGKTENIIAGGVYYAKIDKGFQEDVVEFRPNFGPNGWYSKNTRMRYALPISENCAIVFSNKLPHKFLELVNKTEKPLERLFLNFFIIDPRKKLTSTTMYSLLGNILNKRFHYGIVNMILSFVFSNLDEKKAKERREEARTSLKQVKSGWGYIHYGNCGNVQFLEDIDVYDDELHLKKNKGIEKEFMYSDEEGTGSRTHNYLDGIATTPKSNTQGSDGSEDL